jgi:hypothetical protein
MGTKQNPVNFKYNVGSCSILDKDFNIYKLCLVFSNNDNYFLIYLRVFAKAIIIDLA